MRTDDNCVVCQQRITDSGWLPFCCEVCWDSADAAEQRLAEQAGRLAGLGWVGGTVSGQRQAIVEVTNLEVEDE